tara:strand:+ start:316 stop:459 length:144 start_codon:yes stop_codon:yes gene_type:complete
MHPFFRAIKATKKNIQNTDSKQKLNTYTSSRAQKKHPKKVLLEIFKN